MRAVAVIVSSFFFSTSLTAQGRVDRPFYRIHTGITLPSSPAAFSDFWNPGPNVGGSVGIPVTRAFVAEVDLQYSRIPFDSRKLLSQLGATSSGVSVDGGETTIISASVNAVVRLVTDGSRVAPYFAGGFGLTRRSIGDATVAGGGASAPINGDSGTDILVAFGGGLEFRVTPATGLFVDARYSIGFQAGENLEYLPVRIGVVFR